MPSIETPAAPEATHTPSHDLKASKASAQPFVEVSAPFQHILSTAAFPHLPQNSTFPGVYSPPSKSDDVAGAVKLVEQWAASGELKETLKAHGGALVLRGLPLPTADAFSKVAFATKVGTVPHVEVGRPPKRTVCCFSPSSRVFVDLFPSPRRFSRLLFRPLMKEPRVRCCTSSRHRAPPAHATLPSFAENPSTSCSPPMRPAQTHNAVSLWFFPTMNTGGPWCTPRTSSSSLWCLPKLVRRPFSLRSVFVRNND